MPTTLALIQKARRLAYDYPQMDAVVGASWTTNATVLAVSNGNLYKAGMVVSADEEAMFIQSISTNSLTVLRAFRGTVAAQHTAGAAILVDPAFTGADYLDGLNEGLRALYPYFFKVAQDSSLTISTSVADYVMPSPMNTADTRILRVRILETGALATGYYEWRRWEQYKDENAAPTLHFVGSSLPSTGATIQVTAITPFQTDLTLGGSTDADLLDRGAQALPIYAAAYVLQAQEARRLRDEHARNIGPAAVPPQVTAQLAFALQQKFEKWCAERPQPWPMFYTRRRM